MYFQKDYVLRMIEMMGELVRRICSIAREADARAELDEISQKACGMPMSLLATGDPGTLTDLLGEPQIYLAAELLLIEVEIASRKETEDMLLPLRIQALALFSSLKEPDYMIPASDHARRVMEDALDQLPLESLLGIVPLFERAGQYAAAEDALFAAYEMDPAVKPLIEAYYDRLDAQKDDALRAGGLSRDEIAEGRAALN